MEDPNDAVYKEWPHAPSHLFVARAAYMVTAGTYGKGLLFDTPAKLDYLLATLFEEAKRFGWRMQAWAVMANHYHLVAHAPDDPKTLRDFVIAVHSRSAQWLNRLDQAPGRRVWYQYWDTCLTYRRSYLARLHYVHENPEKHGLVRRAEDYRWCSMRWFKTNADVGFRRTVLSFGTERVNVMDAFD